MGLYTVEFTTRAEQQKMEIPPERRTAFDTALRILLDNPQHPSAIQRDESLWEIRLTQHITIEYMFTKTKLVVLIIEVRDDLATEPLYYE